MKSLLVKVITLSLVTLFTTACTLNVNLDEEKENTGQVQEEVKNENNKTEEERVLLTPSNISEYNSPSNPQCDEVFNSDKPNQTAEYSNLEKGLSVQIPYNPNWGNDRFKLNAYDEYEDRIVFGAIGGFEACTWVRSYNLRFLPAKSSQEVLESLDSNQLLTKPVEVTIGQLKAVKYVNGGLCSYPAIQVIGQRYNYELVPTCGVDSEKEFTFMEDIVKSMKLIGDVPASNITSYTTGLKDNDLLNKVHETLNSGNHKLEVTKKPEYKLPAGIHDAQIDKYYIIDDVFFALVRKPSMNVRMSLPDGFEANFAGLIAADTADKEWKKIFTIEDKESTNKNNPYAIWIDQKALYVSIVDQNGAGSGEGVAKIVKSGNLVNWEQDYCFYFGADYRGPSEDGDYFLFSSFLAGETRSGEVCNNFSLR